MSGSSGVGPVQVSLQQYSESSTGVSLREEQIEDLLSFDG